MPAVGLIEKDLEICIILSLYIYINNRGVDIQKRAIKSYSLM